MFLRPIDGATIQDPITKEIMSATGADVNINTFWLRRIADGSVVVVPQDDTFTNAAESANTRKGR